MISENLYLTILQLNLLDANSILPLKVFEGAMKLAKQIEVNAPLAVRDSRNVVLKSFSLNEEEAFKLSEKAIADMNRSLADNIETVFLTCLPQFTSVASTLVRDVLRNGGDVSRFLPKAVNKSIRKIYKIGK